MSSHEGQPLPGYPLGPPPMTQSPAWPAPSNGRGLKIAIAALAVLLLIAVAGAGFAAIQWQAANARVAQAQDGAHAVTAAAEEARAVADRYAVALTSID